MRVLGQWGWQIKAHDYLKARGSQWRKEDGYCIALCLR